jgi:hypothetical protein
MQSVFSLHDRSRFQVHVYATSPSDGSSFRQRIEADSDQFVDVSSWSAQSTVERIVLDRIHIRTYSAIYSVAASESCPTSHQFGWLHERIKKWDLRSTAKPSPDFSHGFCRNPSRWLLKQYIIEDKAYIDCGLFPGWCDYLVCDAISCPEDLTAESLVRNEFKSRLHEDLDFGPSVGTSADPEYLADDWM